MSDLLDRPIIQSSIEYVAIPLEGPDVDSLVAADLRVAVAPAGGAYGAFVLVDSYDPATGVVLVLVGPTTPIGQLALGVAMFRVKVTDVPEAPILPAGGLEVIA